MGIWVIHVESDHEKTDFLFKRVAEKVKLLILVLVYNFFNVACFVELVQIDFIFSLRIIINSICGACRHKNRLIVVHTKE